MHWSGWELRDESGDVRASVWVNGQRGPAFIAYVKVGDKWEKTGRPTLQEAMAVAEQRVEELSVAEVSAEVNVPDGDGCEAIA